MKLLPSVADNTYKGSKIALYAFYLITIVTIGRSLVHMFKADGGAESIATIPLHSYTEGGASTVILIFALWGLSQLLFGIFYAIIIFKYKSLIPLMYLFIFIEYVMRLVLSILKPIALDGTAPGSVGNYVMIAIIPVFLWLSLKETKNYPTKLD